MDIFVLKDKNNNFLHPSVQATTLAKYSRSPLSAKEILSSLSEEESDKFHSKWTISYGHSSVAELAVLPICFENVSIIASKFIEKFQRAGYSEKSTRYQKFDKGSFINPTNDDKLNGFISRFYDAYEELYPIVLKRVSDVTGLDSSLPKVKARAFDSVRYLLPAGTGTNLAAVMNLRDIRYLVSEAIGHSNQEIREIGKKVFEVASNVCPALLSNVEPDNFEPKLIRASTWMDIPTSPGVQIINIDLNGNEKFLRHLKTMYGMNWEDFKLLMSKRGNRKVPSIFKLLDVELEIVMDYGAFRDLQRHRRCEQFVENLTPNYGYTIPDDILGTDIEEKYRLVMDQVISFNDESLGYDQDLLQYIIPIGYLHRSIFKMDLAELYYIIELRTKPQGHISYRRIAYEMYKQVQSIYPELMSFCNAINPIEIGDHN